MFIKLINASPLHRGRPLLIRASAILTVFEGTAVREDSTIDEVTYIFSPDHGTWEVQDCADDVFKKLVETKEVELK